MPEFDRVVQRRFKSKGAIIAEQLLERIKSGEYPAGSKLPPERVIAEQMGVSRPSVREAVSALHIVGILESRPGDGTYISRALAVDDLTTQAKGILEESDSPYEIMRARKAVEIGIVRMAIKEATDADLEKIKAAWDQKYESGRKGEYKTYTRLGRDLHMAIAKAAKNPIIEAMMEWLLGFTDQPLWQNMRRNYYEQDSKRINQMLQIHNDIVTAILQRNSEKAIVALEADFDAVLEQLYHRNNGN